MRLFKPSIALAVCAAVSLTGCTNITWMGNTFEGAGDSRFAKKEMKADKTLADKVGEFDEKFFKPSDSPLATSAFEEGDYISIHLKNAFFNTLTENLLWERFPNAVVSAFASSRVKGEVAIIINVSEKTLDQLADPGAATNPGRVVYYSNDVYEGQRVNQDFGNVYGPAKWNGNPLTVDITVVEIDQEDNKQMDGLLSSLARVGTSGLAGPSSPLLNALNQVGTAFVYSNKDDVLGRYRITLMPNLTETTSHIPVLHEGDLVVVRKANRLTLLDWGSICYDPATGLLSKGEATGNPAQCPREAFPENYMVLTVLKNAGTVDLTPSLNLAGLNAAIAKSESNAAIDKVVASFAAGLSKESALLRARKAVDALVAKKDQVSQSQRALEAGVFSQAVQCSVLMSDTNLATPAAKKVCGGDKAADVALAPSEREYLIRRFLRTHGSFNAADLSIASLSGDGTEAGLNTARTALAGKFAATTPPS